MSHLPACTIVSNNYLAFGDGEVPNLLSDHGLDRIDQSTLGKDVTQAYRNRGPLLLPPLFLSALCEAQSLPDLGSQRYVTSSVYIDDGFGRVIICRETVHPRIWGVGQILTQGFSIKDCVFGQPMSFHQLF